MAPTGRRGLPKGLSVLTIVISFLLVLAGCTSRPQSSDEDKSANKDNTGPDFVVSEFRHDDPLRVEPFSDPERLFEMPEEWVRKPIEYIHPYKDADIAVNLDQQVYRIMAPLLEEYASERGLKIAITDSTCGNSSGILKRKAADIGGFCCPPADTDRLPGLRFHTLGIASVAILVHPDNPLRNITLDDARNIFRGQIRRWNEVTTPEGQTGPDIPIKTVGRLHCKTRPGHWRLMLSDEDMFSPSLFEVGTIPDMVHQVSSNPAAIGHETVWLAADYYKDQGNVKTIRINGYDPSDLDAVAVNKYPIYKTFSVTTWTTKDLAKPEVNELVQFLKDMMERNGEKYGILPPSRLKKNGWKFKDGELVGEPDVR